MEKSIKAGIWRANLESRSEENQAMLVSLSHSLPALRLRCHGTFWASARRFNSQQLFRIQQPQKLNAFCFSGAALVFVASNEAQHQPDSPGKGSWLSEATQRGEGREGAPSHTGEASSRPAGWRCLPKRCSAGGREARLRFSLLGRHEPSPPGLRVGLPQSGSCSGSVCYHVLNTLWPRFRSKVFLIPPSCENSLPPSVLGEPHAFVSG